jgi:hypothetical protein
VSFWCGCCALIQMIRQDKLNGYSYNACSEDGTFV